MSKRRNHVETIQGNGELIVNPGSLRKPVQYRVEVYQEWEMVGDQRIDGYRHYAPFLNLTPAEAFTFSRNQATLTIRFDDGRELDCSVTRVHGSHITLTATGGIRESK